MDGKRIGKLVCRYMCRCICRLFNILNTFKLRILVSILVSILLMHLMTYCGCRVFIDILAFLYLIGGLFVTVGTGGYYFLYKPFPSKSDVSVEETPSKDSCWVASVLSILETRRNWFVGFNIAVWTLTAKYLGLFIDGTRVKELNQGLVFLGFFVLVLLAFNHGLASWAYTREVKKCPSARFSKEEGVWLLEVTDEILHRLIQADAIGLFVLLALMELLFSLRY